MTVKDDKEDLINNVKGTDVDQQSLNEEKEMTKNCDRKLEEQKEEEKSYKVEGSTSKKSVLFEDLDDPKKGGAFAKS